MVEDGYIRVGSLAIPIRTLALAWSACIGVFGSLTALIVLMTGGDLSIFDVGDVLLRFKIVMIGLLLIPLGLAGLAGFRLLDRDDARVTVGVVAIGLTGLTAILGAFTVMAEKAIPGERFLAILWVLSVFAGLFAVAVALFDDDGIARTAGNVAAGAAALGALLSVWVVLTEDMGLGMARLIAAASLVTIVGSLAGYFARYLDE